MELLDVLFLNLKYHNVFNWKKSRLLVYNYIDGSFVIVIKNINYPQGNHERTAVEEMKTAEASGRFHYRPPGVSVEGKCGIFWE